ncbi:type 1 glutamine amidotransferase-like domain-containing protein [Leptobacterium flavescens]|uniref:Cyanophycinase n=1 Tax=Leptobacterium flavescens TaxID=472055 RepID=A0A6P0UFC9_9FLAO|nr:cyanophycinase [Leptobacterium flavescens]NER11981.1 type 1 glutamine amidotransferase-like domain-containing protein [Leptobacterium flavescens]
MKLKTNILSIAFSLIGILALNAQNGSTATVKGPEKGSLVIVGGGRLSSNIIERFIELAGGKDAPIVVIPTAAGRDSYDERSAAFLKRHGATNVTVLHTADPKVANTDAFVAPLKNAKGVWFGGGRQWRLVDSYAGTKAEKLFWEVLERGGVIGGSSAGATIQGSYLARGDTRNNQIMMGDHEAGFGFLQNVAIDQHVLARNRQFDLFTILKKKPELLGIGIDENTAIIVQNDQFEVLGASYVLMYDSSFWSREGSNLKNLPEKNAQFYFLRSGDKYDLKNRKVITN